MAWSASAIFQQAMVNPIALGGGANTGFPTSYGATGLVGDTVNVALYNNSITPDKTATVANTGYNAGQWVSSGNEVTDPNWPAGGVAATSKSYSLDTGSSSVCFHAANTPGNGTVTLASVYGCFVYDNTITGVTVAKQGMCFNYFGGSQSVTAGTFTILWATPGGAAVTAIFNISV